MLKRQGLGVSEEAYRQVHVGWRDHASAPRLRAAAGSFSLVVMVMSIALMVGCGPSLRGVAQSRVYFENCYAADFDARIPSAEKHACWTAWSEHYTAGQPTDRVRYALGRVHAIENGEVVPALPGLPEAGIGPRAVTPVTVASEEIVGVDPPPEFAPPANADEEELRTPPDRLRHPPRLPRASNQTCALTACEESWRTCAEACPAHDRPCATACEIDMYACARGCF